MRRITLAIVCCLALMLGSQSAWAAGDQSKVRPAGEKWEFLVAVYGWLPGMDGDITVAGQTSSIDLPVRDYFRHFSDVLEALDFAGALHLEARKGDWTFMVDPYFIKLSNSLDLPGPVDGVTVTQQAIVDFGVFYRLGEATFEIQPGGGPNFTFEAFLGGRYFYLKNRIRVSNASGPPALQFGIDVQETQQFADPIFGGRITMVLSPKWTVTLRGDVGGFGVASDLTWSVQTNVIYKAWKTVWIVAGIRALGIDYETGSGANRFAYDVIHYGPQLGVVFRF